MRKPPSPSNVLVVAADDTVAERLCRWITDAGEIPSVADGADPALLASSAEWRYDLVVTCVTRSPNGSPLPGLERFVRGELFFGTPQVHVLEDARDAARLQEESNDLAVTAMVPPLDETEFRTRTRLSAELGRLRRELSHVSIRDGMTGCFNRRFLRMRLEQEFERARRHGNPLALVLLDIDQLRTINDEHGFDVGDRAITQVARVLTAHSRGSDIHGRWGAASFLSILPGAGYRGAAVFANKVRGDTEAFRVRLRKGEVPIRVSAGISALGSKNPVDGPAALLSLAEHAVQEAKQRGGNRVYIDEEVLRAERPLVLIADADRRFLDFAQDLLSLDDVRVVGAETSTTLHEALAYRRPDLLILDLDLAGSEREPDLLETLRTRFGDEPVPILAIAARSEAAERHSGIERYLTKPFSGTVLRSVVRDALNERRRAGQPLLARAFGG